MRAKNYKGEGFLSVDSDLIAKLEDIAWRLEQNLLSLDHHYLAGDILKRGRNAFHKCWPNLIPNNPNNPHSKNEFKGLYGFAFKSRNGKLDWQYIGISKTIKRRFKGHAIRKTKSDASWAYLMCRTQSKIPRIQKNHIHLCYFSFVMVDDNFLLHLAEAYCVNKFKALWNSFETH